MDYPKVGIATDAAHSMKNGVTEYQAIDLSTGERLFYQNLGNQTTNIGEFLGLMAAMPRPSKSRDILEGDGLRCFNDRGQALGY